MKHSIQCAAASLLLCATLLSSTRPVLAVEIGVTELTQSQETEPLQELGPPQGTEPLQEPEQPQETELPEGTEQGETEQTQGLELLEEPEDEGPWEIRNASAWAVENLREAGDVLDLVPRILRDADMKGEITRREMCYLATTAYERITGNEPIPARTDYFTDTDDSLICAAHEIGIVNGYADGTFLPEQLLTRQEFFQILANFNRGLDKPVHLKTDFLKEFKDRDKVDDWAEDAAQEMVALGVVNGTDGMLEPLKNASRQEAIVMFLRNYKEANRYLKTEWLTAEQLAEMNKAAMEQAMTSEAGRLVQMALGYVRSGTPYIFGAAGPNAFDCSGFTSYLYRQIGHPIDRTAQQQTKDGTPVTTRDANGELTFEHLRPGDLLFFANTYSSSDRITHVGIYMGNGQMVHAANSTRGVTVDQLHTGYYYSHFDSARRILE